MNRDSCVVVEKNTWSPITTLFGETPRTPSGKFNPAKQACLIQVINLISPTRYKCKLGPSVCRSIISSRKVNKRLVKFFISFWYIYIYINTYPPRYIDKSVARDIFLGRVLTWRFYAFMFYLWLIHKKEIMLQK